MMDTLIKKSYGVMDVKPEQTGGRAMRMVTALAGVFALAAVTVSGATLEELKTEYNNNPTEETALAVMDEMEPSEAATFGQDAYAETQSEEVALGTVKAFYTSHQPSQAADFGMSAYQDTQYAEIATWTMAGLAATDQHSKAIDFGKTAYNNAEGEDAAEIGRRVASSLLNDGQTDEAISYGKQAFQATPTGGGARSLLNIYADVDRSSEGLEFARIAAREVSAVGGFAGPVSALMESASQAAVVDTLSVIIEERDTLISDQYLPIVKELPDDPKQTIAESVVENHIDSILSQNLTVDEFREEMQANRAYRRMCSDQFRISMWEDIQSIVPLSGEFSDWKAIIEQAMFKIDNL